MIHRHTQTREYWSTYRFTQADADLLSNFLLEAGSPKPISDLALVIIQQHIEKESANMRRDLESHTIYQPKKGYQPGEEILFPALELASGKVIEQRPGRNPDKEPFDVIVVEMADGKRREFAANYRWPHRLNEDNFLAVMSDEQELSSPAQIYAMHKEHLDRVIDEGLVTRSEFLRIANEWFLRALMAEVNIGHLNLAEAVLDVAGGGPLPTSVILQELGLPPDIAGGLQEISLNGALAHDDRFDDVSLDDGISAWFLRRLQPPEVRGIPQFLMRNRFNGPMDINDELRALANELDDELSRQPDEPVEPQHSVSLVLTFPHRRAGTLGWSRRVASVLPPASKQRLPVTFRDRMTDKEIVVWLVTEGAYIYGLADWYKQNELAAGAYLELSRGKSANVVLIDYKRRRPKREWVRVASNRDGHLRLETAQRAVGFEFDELMSVFVDNPATLDALRNDTHRDITQAVRDSFPEIAKLSPQGNVHARTLYAVVNVVTRAAPVDVFAALQASGAYVPVGDNYWHLSETR